MEQHPLDMRTTITGRVIADQGEAKVIRHGKPVSVGAMSRAEVMALAKIVAQAQAIYDALIEKYGEEPDLDGAVIRFTRSFPGRDWNMPVLAQHVPPQRYTYAAIRINGRWWTTGVKQDGGYAWEELLAWIDESDTHEIVEVLSQGVKNVTGVIAERHPGLDDHEPNAPAPSDTEGRHAAK